jgi:predicted ATPase/class 3 adenylate cyclase
MHVLPTGTVTFLFSDIEGSTRLLQRVGGESYADLRGQHQALLRAAWVAHQGVEIGTEGDSFFVAFPSAPQAVAAAAEATQALSVHAWPEGADIRVRIGLHTGVPLLAGDTYVGLDVHRAARIAAAGHGGQVLLSEATRALVVHELPVGVMLRDLGAHRLKDLQHAEQLFQVVLPGLPSDFSPLKSLDGRPHNLPVQPTPLLGREQVLGAVSTLLRRDDVRLVTLTGPGGIGKTRLSVQVAAELLDDFSDGVWFVRLSRLTDPALVVKTVAQTLGLKEQGSQPIAETLREHLHDRYLLLVLDNFEQLVGAAPEVSALLEAAPRLKVLVTSRMALHLRGEREQPLAPLPLPDTSHLPPPERLSQYAAVALFVERAQATRPDFAITVSNALAIAEICARLDGLPLALELAAARVKLLPPEALLARLFSRLKLLTGGPRDLEARQQTMRATIAWSEELLAPDERALFRRLAVFLGGCTLEAAEAVCAAPAGGKPLEIDLLDGLATLVDQSLVQQREEDGEPRFGMLHVIREYALERLEESGEAEALRQAHAGYYLTLAEQAEQGLRGPDQTAWLEQLEREHDNLRAALGWSLEHGAPETAVRLCGALGYFWVRRGHWNEGRRWLGRALNASEAVPLGLHAQLLKWAGFVARMQGEYMEASALLEESLSLFREVGDTAGTGDVLAELGQCAVAQEQLERAARQFEESLAFLEAAGNRPGVLYVLEAQVQLAEGRGDFPAASKLLEQALALAEVLGDAHMIAMCKMELGEHALLRGDDAVAASLLHEALTIQQDLNDTNCSSISLRELGALALERGDSTAAQELLEQSLAGFEELSSQASIARTLVWLGLARFAASDIEGAESTYLASLHVERLLANRQGTATCFEGLAEVALARGQPARAVRLLGAAAQVLGELPPAPLPPTLAARRERVALDARQALGEEAWAVAYEAGQALSLEEAVAEVMGKEGEGADA